MPIILGLVIVVVLVVLAVIFGYLFVTTIVNSGQEKKKLVSSSNTPAIVGDDKIFHLNEKGMVVRCYSRDTCLIPSEFHSSSAVFHHNRQIAEIWIDWREEEMARNAAVAEMVHGNNRSWHVDRNYLVPCERQYTKCIPTALHFANYQTADRSLPPKVKRYIITDHTEFADYDFRKIVRRVYEDRLLTKNGYDFSSFADKEIEKPEHNVVIPEISVNRLKVEIGKLRSDITWVIDHPSFFDNNSAVTEELFLKLAEWDDSSREWDVKQQTKTANEIQELFVNAKTLAAEIGFDYLHGDTRKSMQKASALAKKALSTNHQEEAAVYMARVAAILSATIGVTIPTQTIKAVEQFAKKALPNSPTSEQKS